MKLTPDILADLVVGTIKRAVDGPQVAGRIARLETELVEARREIEQLKARPMPKYCGVYRDGAAHTVGDLVTKRAGCGSAPARRRRHRARMVTGD